MLLGVDVGVLAAELDTGGALGILIIILVVLAIIALLIWLVRR